MFQRKQRNADEKLKSKYEEKDYITWRKGKKKLPVMT